MVLQVATVSSSFFVFLLAASGDAFSLQCTKTPLSTFSAPSMTMTGSYSRPQSLPHFALAPQALLGRASLQSLPQCRLSTKPQALAILRSGQTLLSQADNAAAIETKPTDGKLEKLASSIGTSTWLSWWVQVILSVVSTVTLFFANAVKGAGQGNILTNGIFLAGIGLALSFINVFWTWGYSSMGRNLTKSTDASKSVTSLRRAIKVGVIVALSGMLITLLGAEQIVGTLVAKSMSGFLILGQGNAQAAAMQLQALDILVVQVCFWPSLANAVHSTRTLQGVGWC